MVRSPRAGARREVLRQVRQVKDRVLTLQSWWTAKSVVYVEPADRQADHEYLRERRVDEYPEMQRRYWAGTIRELDELSKQVAGLRAYAIEQYRETTDTEGDT